LLANLFFLHQLQSFLRKLNGLQITIQEEYFSICIYCLSEVVESHFFSRLGAQTQVAIMIASEPLPTPKMLLIEKNAKM